MDTDRGMDFMDFLNARKANLNRILKHPDYSKEYKQRMTDEFKQDLLNKKNLILDEEIEEIQDRKNSLIKKHTPKQISDIEYLAKRTRIQDKAGLMTLYLEAVPLILSS